MEKPGEGDEFLEGLNFEKFSGDKNVAMQNCTGKPTGDSEAEELAAKESGPQSRRSPSDPGTGAKAGAGAGEPREDSETGFNANDAGDSTLTRRERLVSDMAAAAGLICWAHAELFRAVHTFHELNQDEAEADIAAAEAAAAAEAHAAEATGATTGTGGATATSGDATRRRKLGLTPAEIRDVAERSFIAEVACVIKEHENTARNLAFNAEMLTRQLPDTLTALDEGTITVRQVRDVIDQVIFLPDEIVPPFEQVALEKAAAQTANRFHRTARALRERMHPESIAVRKQAARLNRRVDWEPAHDGMSWLNLYLPSEHVTGIRARLTAHAEELASYDDENRTKAQLEADVATDLLLNGTVTPNGTAPPNGTVTKAQKDTVGLKDTMTPKNTVPPNPVPESGTQNTGTAPDTKADTITDSVTGTAAGIDTSGVRATVYVTVPVLTLLGLSEEPAELDGVGPISPDTARQLCANAKSFYRILTHPVTGAYLSIGRESYRPPADLKRFLEVRDKNCRFPGCTRSVKHCDVDHTIAWAAGGETNATNTCHLCRNHHRLKHHTRWRVIQRDDGELAWESPTGHSYTTRPEYPEPVPVPEKIIEPAESATASDNLPGTAPF